jgi:serine/threonine-protein kinase
MFSHDDRDSDSPTPSGASAPGEPAMGATAASAADLTDPHLDTSALGSGLLAQQPTPSAEEAVAVSKVCPQCGTEYETGSRFCPKDGSPLRPKAAGDPLVGRVIADRYLILARIGEGGMGRVYLAEHVKMTRQCAIKVMNPSLVTDSESLQRFAREASNAARILHPNVAAVFDYGEAEKIVYLVMEYVDGESLSTILEREHVLEPRRAIEIARQVADGLAAAHELGIVHRDLKPDNVIIARTRGGKEIPKVVDFGIAKAMSEAPQDALTRSGLVIGTPEYMSPEQLLGDPVDARADIYSLGCILYQMLTGEPAFAAESREQMIRRRLHETPPHVREVLPALPRRLDTLIVHMLARSPADRLASAAEARDQLDPALALGGWDPASVSGRRLSPVPSMKMTRRPADPSLQPTMPLPRQQTSTRVGIVVLTGTALLIAGLLALPRVTDYWRSTQPAATAQTDSTDTASVAAAAPESIRVGNTKIPALQPDSTLLLSKKPPAPPPTDTASIQQSFDPINNAVRSGLLAEVDRAFPALPPNERTWFGQLFARGAGFTVTPNFSNWRIGRDTADVVFTLHVRYHEKNAAEPNATTRRYQAKLVRRGSNWQITELVAKVA